MRRPIPTCSSLCKQAPNDSWKSAPPVPWLASLAPLFQRYAKVAPNSVILSSKHKVAIKRLVETKKINHTRKTNEDFADLIDNTIRMGLNHFRNMKQNGTIKERAYRRADKIQQDALDSVLSLLVCKAESEAETSLVPYERKDASLHEETPSPKAKAMSSTPNQDLSPNKVFDKVLTHPDDDDENVEECRLEGCTLKIFKDVAQKGQPSKGDEESPVKGPWVLATKADDDALLSRAASTKPLAEDGKSQQRRLNAVKPKKKSKGNTKGKTTKQEKQKGKECKEAETTNDAGGSGKGSKKNKGKGNAPMKRPSAAGDCVETDFDEGKFVIGAVPDDSDLPRTKIRHRFTSKAYHDTRNAVYKSGKTDIEAKGYGAAAARKGGQIFDAGWPNDMQHKKDEDGTVAPTTSTKPMKAMKVKEPKKKEEEEHQVKKVKKAMKKKKGGKSKMKKNVKNGNPEEDGSYDDSNTSC